jgi:hypothetical protein
VRGGEACGQCQGVHPRYGVNAGHRCDEHERGRSVTPRTRWTIGYEERCDTHEVALSGCSTLSCKYSWFDDSAVTLPVPLSRLTRCATMALYSYTYLCCIPVYCTEHSTFHTLTTNLLRDRGQMHFIGNDTRL